MNENVMSQLDAELEHAGEETALSPADAIAGAVENYAGEGVAEDGIPVPAV